MSGNKTQCMAEAKVKLMNLRQHLPGANDPMVAFGQFMSGRLNSYQTPDEFADACERALYDLVTGVDSFSREKIVSPLIGYTPMIFALLRREVPGIAEAVFPSDFASDVKIAIDRMSAPVKRTATQHEHHAR